MQSCQASPCFRREGEVPVRGMVSILQLATATEAFQCSGWPTAKCTSCCSSLFLPHPRLGLASLYHNSPSIRPSPSCSSFGPFRCRIDLGLDRVEVKYDKVASRFHFISGPKCNSASGQMPIETCWKPTMHHPHCGRPHKPFLHPWTPPPLLIIESRRIQK